MGTRCQAVVVAAALLLALSSAGHAARPHLDLARQGLHAKEQRAEQRSQHDEERQMDEDVQEVVSSLHTVPRAKGCTCEDASLCRPVAGERAKEVFGFIWPTDTKHFRQYNWTRLSSVAWQEDPELVCLAHQHQARVIINANSVGNLSGVIETGAGHKHWVRQAAERALLYALDGVNFDYEAPIQLESDRAKSYARLITLTTRVLHVVAPGSQVSVDVPWSPYDVDGRNYAWREIAEGSDLLFVMAYDMQSQVWGRCVAQANSPLPLVERGLRQWMDLGVSPDQLVLGLPWYEYDYPCEADAWGRAAARDADVCLLRPVGFVGAPCSDAAGAQRNFIDVMQLLRAAKNVTPVAWEPLQQTFRFNYVADDGRVHQVWFDSPEALRLRYELAARLGLRGVGFWNLESLHIPEDASAAAGAERQAMWQAVESGFFGGGGGQGGPAGAAAEL